jgi:hypothetical protein
MSHIFISYSKRNRRYASKLADSLLDAGFDVWIDDRIDYGENWWTAIVEAIKNCGAFVVIMTPDSKTSGWVQREVALAIQLDKPLFPVLLEGENWPLFVQVQYVDALDGRLPPIDFLGRLADFVPRGQRPGIIVTPTKEDYVQSLSGDTTSTADNPTLAGEPTSPMRPQPSRRRWLWPLSAILIVLIGFAVFYYLNWPRPGPVDEAQTQTAIALLGDGTNTPTEIPTTATPLVGPTDTPSETPTPSETATSTLTDTPTAISTCTPVPPVSDPLTLIVRSPGVYVRSVPNTASEFITDYAMNQNIPLTGRSTDNSYYRVDFNGQTSWILNTGGHNVDIVGDLENLVAGLLMAVENPGAYVRSAPSTDSETIVGYVENQYLLLTGLSTNDMYYLVDFDGQPGWILNTGGARIDIDGNISDVPRIEIGSC